MQDERAATVPAYDQVMAALDGSSYAESVLPLADELSGIFAAALSLVAFGVEPSHEEELTQRLIDLAGDRDDAEVWSGVDWDPAAGLVDLLGDDDRALLCMASHARRGVTGALLGSVAADMLTRWRHPIMLVGPADRGDPIGKGPVVACVDGTDGARAALPAAAGWADRLAVALHVVTVAEPVPAASDGHHTRRHHGPDDDPLRYVHRIATEWQTPERDAEGFVLYDPVSVAEPLADYTIKIDAALVVVASRPRSGAARAILGSAATGIVRSSPTPVLVVPRLD